MVFRSFLCISLLAGALEGPARAQEPPAESAKPGVPAPGKILGADISFLPELESKGKKFYDHGVEKDAILLLKDNGFNYIRLRLFADPAADSGYSPHKGFCDLSHTIAMAKRIKAAGMGFLLDFHYSDTWADPGKQFIPSAWLQKSFEEMTRAMRDYTRDVLLALKAAGALPDMVQIGNEINHGILWPVGSATHWDSLATLLKAGIQGVKEVSPTLPIILHLALGGQNAESRTFLDQMLAHHVPFDIIGESYYPQWHGTLSDLEKNLTDLASRYSQPIIVVEYTAFKKEVNDIEFHLPGYKGVGTFIWEPLNTWERFIDEKGNTNSLIDVYPKIRAEYGIF